MHARTITRRRSIALLTIALMAGTATHALAQVVPAPYVEPGKPGDPASWAGTTEFKNQWGLGVINAQYAYALGYTGKGVGLGVFDTGTSNFLHEFDGRFVAVESKGTLNVAMDAAGVPWNIPNPPIHAGDAYELMGDRTIVGDQHGTEVGGVIAAARNGVDSNAHGMQGVAFGATLVAANGLYVGPNNGSIEAIDAGLFGAALDGFVANNVRVVNNSWEILPNAWVNDSSGKVKTSATGPLTDVIDQYNTDTSKKVFDVMHSAARDHQMLFVAAAGNGGSVLVPTAFASLPYFQPDMTGYMISVVNLGLAKSTYGAKFPGNTDYVLATSSTPCAQTRQWCVAAPGSSIVSTGFDIGDYNSANARTLEQALAVTDPTLLTASQKSLLSIYPGSVFDDVNKTWFYPSYKTTNGTSVAAPFVTGEAGIAMQRFPWMTTPQITEAILTTSRYLPDGTAGADVINKLNGAALSMTQIPNFQTGWGLIDLKSLMNGPAQLLTSETYTLPTGIVDVFSNSITDAWLRYEQKTQDPADETAWQAEIVAKGWQNGLPANASATDSSEYKFQLARAADRAARAADPGNFIKAGPGTLTLTGSNTYSGATEVQAGLLNIDGINKNSRAIVDDGGTLGGSGSSHGLWVKSGGIVAPGHSIGSLYFDDAGIQLDAGSIYRAELGPKGASDQLITTGTASIDRAKLLLTREGGLTALTSSELDTILNGGVSQRYTLLTAAKGITGAFDTSLMQASDAFQRLQLIYSTSSVALRASPAAYVDPGKLGDPDSWKSAEFNSDWALGAINAQYAYALGITGAGVKLGDLDDGTLGISNEFAGDGKFISVHSVGVLEYPMPDQPTWAVPNPPVNVGDKFDIEGGFSIVFDQHGTHTGGIIAANRDGQGVHGVSFGATLVAANALYAGPYNGIIETFDPNVFKTGIDGIIAAGSRVANNSWGISPDGWTDSNSGGAVGTLADVANQYNIDTTKEIFNTAADAAHNSQMLFVFAAGNGGPNAPPDALTSMPYFRPDMTGYLFSVVNLARPTDSYDVGASFAGVTDYVMSWSSTPCDQTRGWCVAAPGTNINSTYFINRTGSLASYQAAVAKPASQRSTSEAATVARYAADAQYIDAVHKVWYVPSYAQDTGTSMAAPMVTGTAGLAIQRFPWITTPQIAESIMTTSRYLPDAKDAALNALNGAAMSLTQIPNFQTGWGMIDIKNLMNGPAQLMWTETYTLPAGVAAVFSNKITDAWLKYEQSTQDPADEAAWQAEIAAKGWKDGLPATATDVDRSEYTYQMARAADRAARANDHGDLIKAGPGTLTLTGTNTYSGATEIKEGLLNLDGVNRSSRAIVDAGGTLGGGGTSHGLWAKAGGIVAPGHSIGTLYFDDAGIQLDAGSIYRAELAQNYASDRLVTTGAASIGGASLLLTLEGNQTALTSAELDQILSGDYTRQFLLIAAQKGITGAFDTSLMQASDAKDRLHLIYRTTSVSLTASPVPAYVEPGRLGDPNSWITDEFNADWGLGAINAQAAYALGITGKGVKLGDFDTGTLSSSAFTGEGKYNAIEVAGTLTADVDPSLPWPGADHLGKAGDPYDLSGDRPTHAHGTMTAGIVSANRDGQGTHGVAFDSSLYAETGADNMVLNTTTMDPDMWAASLDAFAAHGVHIINNSWTTKPMASVAAVANEYGAGDTLPMMNHTAHQILQDDLLLVFGAANSGAQSVPDSFASLPYFRPDLAGHVIVATNVEQADTNASFGGGGFGGGGFGGGGFGFDLAPDPMADTGYLRNPTSTACGQTRAWCVAAPGTSIRVESYSDLTSNLVPYEAAVADPSTAANKALIASYASYAQYIDDVHHMWLVPSLDTQMGTSLSAPMVTGLAGLMVQRFPWMSMTQVSQVILTTSHYLPDGTDVDALPGNEAMAITQVPNLASGWGLVDAGLAMNGPAQMLWTQNYIVQTDAHAVFSNNITDTWLKYEQTTQDLADEAAWQAEIADRGWQNGVASGASAEDQSEYTYQTARAADRAARANDHGDLIKSGPGTLTLTGTNTYSGATEIKEGLLNLDGVNTNSRAIVDAGGTLGGGGTGHGLWARAGGVVAPGHSIGALHFDDAGIQLEAGSIYHAELGQNGAADLLATTGAASINAAKLLATKENSSSALTYAELHQLLNGHESQSFLLLTADQGVSGAFDTSLMQASDAFQHLQLNYSTTSVSLLAFQTSGEITQDGLWPRTGGMITNDPTPWIDTTPSAEPEAGAPTPIGKPAIVDVTIEPGARYTPGTGDGGLPEPLITTGKGQIGGSHLSVPLKMIKTLTKLAPNKGMFQTYEILNAQQGLEGTFAEDDLPKFVFFNLSLNYSENTVTLDVLHRDIGFADIAATPNQAAVAAGADRLKPDNIIHDTILYVPTVQEARLDYQYLSGELHGDVAGEVLDDSRIMRDAVLERMAKRVPDTSAFWLKTIGSFGSTASDHNAVKVSRQTDGLMAGADMVLGDSWIVGAAANYEGTPLRTAGMGIASITSYHLAGYGGGNLLGLSLHIGGAYGHYNTKTTRVVGVPELAGIEQARYGANQSQAFGELGLPLAFDDTAIEPFAGIAYTDAGMEGFAETGGPASLTARDQSLDRTQSTLGARLSVTYRDNETVFTPNLELAWAHAFSGVRPGMVMAFVDGPASNEFTVSGTSADRDAAVIRVGLDAAIGDGFSVGAGYEGQIGPHAQDHGVRLDIRVNY